MINKLDDLTHLPIPQELYWINLPLEWEVCKDESLSITAGKSTDLFIDPQGGYSANNSPRLMFKCDSIFQLSAKVEVKFQATYDAGALLLYQNEESWAKLCFELSPQNLPTIVTVVNRTVSDDCNSVSIESNSIFLRIAKLKHAFAFHYSIDSKYWHLVRYFKLEQNEDIAVGFSSQSPMGNACNTVFSRINYSLETINDIRDGE